MSGKKVYKQDEQHFDRDFRLVVETKEDDKRWRQFLKQNATDAVKRRAELLGKDR
jgi:hypothetical protein